MLRSNAPWTTVAPAGATEHEIIEVYHLSGAENGGQHHVFVEVEPPDAGLMIGWTWEGRRNEEAAPPVALEKGTPGAAGDVPIFKGQRLMVWLQRGDQCVSDTVANLNGEFASAQWEVGNSLYHHSYRVKFRRRNTAGPPTPPTPAEMTLEERVLRLERLAGVM